MFDSLSLGRAHLEFSRLEVTGLRAMPGGNFFRKALDMTGRQHAGACKEVSGCANKLSYDKEKSCECRTVCSNSDTCREPMSVPVKSTEVGNDPRSVVRYRWVRMNGNVRQ